MNMGEPLGADVGQVDLESPSQYGTLDARGQGDAANRGDAAGMAVNPTRRSTRRCPTWTRTSGAST